MRREFLSRRQLLHRAAGGFGAIALAGLWSESTASAASPLDPLVPRATHFSPRAQRVIFIFATGGASHVDTFDYKPKLFADHGKSAFTDNFAGMGQATAYLKRPNWPFKPYGQSGLMVSDLFPHVGSCADDLCVIRSLHGDSPGHDKATMGMHTGSFNFARPSVGAWVSYGLGSENQNLPSFMVLAP